MQRAQKARTTVALLRKAARPVVRKGWWHWIRFAILLAMGSYLGHLLSESPRFADIRYAMYQWQVHLQHRERIYPQHTVLLLLNDDDYWSDEYQARSPYKRDKLGALLDKLNDAGANIVAFDIAFSSPLQSRPDYDFSDYVAEDRAFFAAVRRMCDAGRHVVLINQLDGGPNPPFEETPTIYQSRLPSLPCVSVGHDLLPVDMRKIAGMLRLKTGGYMDSLSLAIVKIADPVAYRTMVRDEDKGFRFGKYLSADDFRSTTGRTSVFNGKAIEAMRPIALRQAVADRVVIVGGDYSTLAYGKGDHVDTHNSPGGPEVGAMLHANYVEAELNQDSTFTPISDFTAGIVEWVLALTLALVGALEVRALWKWGSVAVAFAISLLLTYVLMQNLGLFLDFFVPFVMIVVHSVTEEILAMRRELHHANKLLKEKLV